MKEISEQERQRRRDTMKRIRRVNFGNENGRWKGENVGITALHVWVANHRGRINFCEHCGSINAKKI